MITYSLIQTTLEQKISRESLEDASVVAKSVARSDCANLWRDLYGFLVSGLPLEEATAFQAELNRRGFSTEVLPDHEIPALHPHYTVQRLAIDGDMLHFTDAMGRKQSQSLKDLVFVGGGFLTFNRRKQEWKLMPKEPTGHYRTSSYEMRPTRVDEKKLKFRLDFFFWKAPHRLRLALTDDTMIFYQNQPVRLRDNGVLLAMMADLAMLMPPERMSRGLLKKDSASHYPSVHAYEEEIRWHFLRLK